MLLRTVTAEKADTCRPMRCAVLQVRLGLDATGALATAAAAVAKYNESMGYAEEGLAQHKASGP